MNPIILHFVDGTTFFVGMAVALVAEALLIRFHARAVRPVLTVLVLVGAILVGASSTPLPVWMYLAWWIVALAGLLLGSHAGSSLRSRCVAWAVLLVTTAGLCLAELPYHRTPHIVVRRGTTVYVLGDSISAGMGVNERCWPTVLKEMTALRVVNLAQPGATVESAIIQAKGITEPGALVIVEIGGNNLLGGSDAATFSSQFENLISSLRSAHHQVLIVELPLFPFQNAFGRAQRGAAVRHGAALLPKRVFTKVLGTRNGTLDGLHLSQEGHNAMARSIAAVIQAE